MIDQDFFFIIHTLPIFVKKSCLNFYLIILINFNSITNHYEFE
jgi:hypothetical protein